MKLNLLLVVSALVYGVAGFALTFAPAEVLAAFGSPASGVATWIAQLLGAALLALALLDWLQRYATVGGVLGRPVLLTNLLFVTASFFASLGVFRHHGGASLLAASAVFGALLVAFGLRLLGVPRPAKEGASAA